MKLITILLLTFFISQTLLNAKDIYIQVTSTSSKNTLRAINNHFKKMKLKMIYKTTSTKYFIYSGPYTNENDSTIALKKIKHYFPQARIPHRKKDKDDGTYLNIAIGYSSTPSTHEVQTGCVIIDIPNNKGISYNIDGGYTFKNGFAIGFGYLRFDATDLLFDNVYGSINYRFNDYSSFIPYVGALGGYSSLKWFTDPIPNPVEGSNNDSSSFLFGTQTGVIYKMSGIVSLYIGYQCLFMNHITNITVDSKNRSKLKHNTLHTMQIGFHF